MGYRSDVDVVFYTLDTDKLPYAVIKLWFDENYPHKEAHDAWGADIEHGEDYIRVSYRGWKWYSDYEEVQAVERAVESFCHCFDTDGEGTDAAYEMAEVGEEVNDIQTKGSAFCTYRLNVNREIVFD
jgi:hypothetical protein